MPEILTESFCERCGTRYTFESAAPKQRRLGRFKVLSQGFKNFVLSDDTSFDEALAAARNDEEREAVTQQLDAFHKTFNFCMNCRQYTCSNCWNEAEGRCLTCAPHLGHEVLPAAFPTLETNGNGAGVDDGPRLDGLAWPTLDLPPEPPAVAADLAWPEAPASSSAPVAEPTWAPEAPAHDETPATRDDGLPDWASLLPAAEPTEAEAPAEPVEVETPAEPLESEAIAQAPVEAEAAEPVEEVEVPAEATVEAEAPAEPVEAEAPEPEWAEQAAVAEAATSEGELETSTDAVVDDRAAAAAAQTADLLARFRPGQSIDAALDEYEATLAAQDEGAPTEAAPVGEPKQVAEPVAEPAVPLPEPVAEPVAAIDETPLETEAATPLDEVLAEVPPLEPEIAAAIVETQPEAAPPQIEPAQAEPAQAEPVPAESAEPEPVAAEAQPPAEPTSPTPPAPVAPPAAPADDRVEVPVWRIVAPETPTPGPEGRPTETPLPPAATAEPQWPQTPAWPGQEPQVDVSFLAARLSHKPSNDALWAASSRDVLAPLPQQPATPAVQTCVSCGLSLSATARFCRRCGSRQGG
jgi:hypothetical protein